MLHRLRCRVQQSCCGQDVREELDDPITMVLEASVSRPGSVSVVGFQVNLPSLSPSSPNSGDLTAEPEICGLPYAFSFPQKPKTITVLLSNIAESAAGLVPGVSCGPKPDQTDTG